MTDRRSFLSGLTGFIACSPAIVRASSLMPVKTLVTDADWLRGYLNTQISLGYAITRESLEDNLYNQGMGDFLLNPPRGLRRLGA